jgi:hypothetical protein
MAEEPNTLDDDRRWKKHYRTAKMQCYLTSGKSPLYRENYDKIEWNEPRRDERSLQESCN